MRGEGSPERGPGRVLQGGGGRGENSSLSNLYSKRETPPPPTLSGAHTAPLCSKSAPALCRVSVGLTWARPSLDAQHPATSHTHVLRRGDGGVPQFPCEAERGPCMMPGSSPLFLLRASLGVGVRGWDAARPDGTLAVRRPGHGSPWCPWSHGTPRSPDGGRKAEGRGWRGPVGAADKRLLTIGLSARGSPNWFVSGWDLSQRGAAGVADGLGRGWCPPSASRCRGAPGPGAVRSQHTWGSHARPSCPRRHAWVSSLPYTPRHACLRPLGPAVPRPLKHGPTDALCFHTHPLESMGLTHSGVSTHVGTRTTTPSRSLAWLFSHPYTKTTTLMGWGIFTHIQQHYYTPRHVHKSSSSKMTPTDKNAVSNSDVFTPPPANVVTPSCLNTVTSSARYAAWITTGVTPSRYSRARTPTPGHVATHTPTL